MNNSLFNLSGISNIETLLSTIQSYVPIGEGIIFIFFVAPFIYTVMKGWSIKVVLPASLLSAFTISVGVMLLGLIISDLVIMIGVLLALSLLLSFL